MKKVNTFGGRNLGSILGLLLILAGASIGIKAGTQLVSINPVPVDPTCDMPDTEGEVQLVAFNEARQEEGQPQAAQDGQEHRGRAHSQAPSEEARKSQLEVKPDLFIKDPYA